MGLCVIQGASVGQKLDLDSQPHKHHCKQILYYTREGNSVDQHVHEGKDHLSTAHLP